MEWKMIRIISVAIFALFVSIGGVSAQTCSVPNTLANGTNADANAVMANFNALVTCINSGGSTTSALTPSGRLIYVSATQLVFGPFNGNQLKVSGSNLSIPAGGIAGCGNTGVYVNGASGQNLGATTLYYVYAFSNAGTPTCDFSTTGHATSSTSGNVGTEIKSGDDTRSLIGMILTSSSSQFVSSATQRYVRTWFNDGGVSTINFFSARQYSTSTTWVELNSQIRNEALLWGGELWSFQVGGGAFNYTTNAACYTSFGVDGITPEPGGSFANSANTTSATAISGVGLRSGLSEGYHYVTMIGEVSSGQCGWESGTDGFRATLAASTRKG